MIDIANEIPSNVSVFLFILSVFQKLILDLFIIYLSASVTFYYHTF
jgi:hypothetical protein